MSGRASSTMISLEVDNDSALPRLLEGRTIAILGGPLDNHTAEAQEPSRRLRIHDQLQRARQLRASLEEAADLADALPDDAPSSYPAAMDILKRSLPQINRLVRLTEALQGKHAVDDPEEYDEWNEWTARRKEREEAQRKRERRVLRRQLREFAKEKNPKLVCDEVLEARHDSLIPRPREDGGRDDGEEVADDSNVASVGVAAAAAAGEEVCERSELEVDESWKESVAPRGNSTVGAGSDGGSEFEPKKRTKRKRRSKPTDNNAGANVPVQAIPGDLSVANDTTKGPEAGRARVSHVLLPQPMAKTAKADVPVVETSELEDAPVVKEDPARKNPVKTNEAAIEQRKPPPETMISKPLRMAKAEAPAQVPAPAPVRPKKAKAPRAKLFDKKIRPPKKCHYCKGFSSRYRNCHYWHPTGKCRKSYCVDCLSSKYTLGDDVKSPSNPNGTSIEEIISRPKLDAEWHCPSCLGACECAACVKERKREAEREKTQAEAGRKSSRRSAGGTYSYFF